jgi:hypothetical protein
MYGAVISSRNSVISSPLNSTVSTSKISLLALLLAGPRCSHSLSQTCTNTTITALAFSLSINLTTGKQRSHRSQLSPLRLQVPLCMCTLMLLARRGMRETPA